MKVKRRVPIELLVWRSIGKTEKVLDMRTKNWWNGRNSNRKPPKSNHW